MIQARDVDLIEPKLDADIAHKTKRYPTDLPDEEWVRIQPLTPSLRSVDASQRRLARDAQCDPLHGAQWWWVAYAADQFWSVAKTVYWWFRRFVRRMLFKTVHDVSLMLNRKRVGREASPSGCVIDSQTVKAQHAKERGYDANKKIVGRKRHIAVDTDGRLLMVNVTTADISYSAGAQAILDAIRKRWPWLKHLFADSAYDRTKLLDKAAFRDFVLQALTYQVLRLAV